MNYCNAFTLRRRLIKVHSASLITKPKQPPCVLPFGTITAWKIRKIDDKGCNDAWRNQIISISSDQQRWCGQATQRCSRDSRSLILIFTFAMKPWNHPKSWMYLESGRTRRSQEQSGPLLKESVLQLQTGHVTHVRRTERTPHHSKIQSNIMPIGGIRSSNKMYPLGFNTVLISKEMLLKAEILHYLGCMNTQQLYAVVG